MEHCSGSHLLGDILLVQCYYGRPSDLDGKESTCSAGDLGLIPGSGRSPREGNDYPLQYSCLENSMDRGAWWESQEPLHLCSRKELDMTEQLNKCLTMYHVFLTHCYYI